LGRYYSWLTDCLFLRFEIYTPNISHFGMNTAPAVLKNRLRVRAVNMLGAKGKSSVFVVNNGEEGFGDLEGVMMIK